LQGQLSLCRPRKGCSETARRTARRGSTQAGRAPRRAASSNTIVDHRVPTGVGPRGGRSLGAPAHSGYPYPFNMRYPTGGGKIATRRPYPLVLTVASCPGRAYAHCELQDGGRRDSGRAAVATGAAICCHARNTLSGVRPAALASALAAQLRIRESPRFVSGCPAHLISVSCCSG
jgi:hypothetical protein